MERPLRACGRIPTAPLRAQSNWDAGVLFRVGIGSIERENTTPWIFAPGLYLARHIRSRGHATSWRVQGSYSHAWYASFLTTGAGGPPHSDRVDIGLDWYR